jgi:hypothetical protein
LKEQISVYNYPFLFYHLGELQSILVFNRLKHAGQREYDKPDSGVNGQTQLMQQHSHVMCVNGPVRAERVWWPMGECIDGDSIPGKDIFEIEESYPLPTISDKTLWTK